MTYVALIAGEGKMPLRLIEEIHRQNKKVFLLGIKGVTPKELENLVDQARWAHITQIGKARRICQENHIKEAVMAGLVRHKSIFKLPFWLSDWVTLKAFLNLKDLRTNTICDKVIELFEEKGIEFVSTTKLLKNFLAPLGFLSTKRPTSSQKQDIEFGIQLAKELGRLDIGQTVVVKNKSVVALEAMEGTDQCLQRAGDIAGPGCVVVKLPKPNQDQRYDVPVIGINTIEKLVKIKASVLAVAAHQTLVIDSEVKDLATRNNIVLLSIEL